MPINDPNMLLNTLLNSYGSVNQLLGQYQSWSINFQGNAEQEVRAMLNRGQLSQQQFNMVAQLAQVLQNGYNNNGY